MKTKFIFVLIIAAFLFGLIGITNASTFDAGGDRLVTLQNDDGGWDWPLDDGSATNASPQNTIAPISMGLAKAYLQTGSAGQLSALADAGAFLLNKTNTFATSDGYLAVQLDSIFGVSTYSNHVKKYFYDPLAIGSYDRKGLGTTYDTDSYVSLIGGARESQGIANLAAWDIGMGLYSANLIGADASAWITGTKNEIDQLDGNSYYDVLGLAGALIGLASAGEDYNPTAGEHTDADNIGDLAEILLTYQIITGGFAWNSDYVIPNDDNESVQETAYSILALAAIDSTLYSNGIKSAANWLMGVQLATGGWEGYSGSGENNEITGEALWAVGTAVPEPATMLLLGFGLLGIAGVSRKKQK